MTWREHAAAALRAAGPTKADKQMALKRASETWHGHHKRNPSSLVKYIVIGGIAYLALKALAPKPGPMASAAGSLPDFWTTWWTPAQSSGVPFNTGQPVQW